VPVAPGVKVLELAVAVLPVPGVSVTGLPTAAPPVGQPAALVSGPQTENVTVPVGLPAVAFPVTVAPSVLVCPSVIVALPGVDDVGADACVAVKHSSLVPSLDAA
jgi:hypothetical protein